jgi:hypothetical protein
MNMNMKEKLKDGYGWAWAIQDDEERWTLCHWVQPDKVRLIGGGKPSSEAIPVFVKITPARKSARRKM